MSQTSWRRVCSRIMTATAMSRRNSNRTMWTSRRATPLSRGLSPGSNGHSPVEVDLWKLDKNEQQNFEEIVPLSRWTENDLCFYNFYQSFSRRFDPKLVLNKQPGFLLNEGMNPEAFSWRSNTLATRLSCHPHLLTI